MTNQEILYWLPLAKWFVKKLSRTGKIKTTEDREDALQEALLAIFRGLKEFPAAHPGYLVACMRNQLVSQARKAEVFVSLPEEFDLAEEPEETDFEELYDQLARLPSEQQKLLRGLYGLGEKQLTRKEYGEPLDMTGQTIHTWEQQALEALRERMGACLN